MLITDVRYFKPQIITAIFRANKTIAEHEEVTKLAVLQKGETKEYAHYTFSVQYKDFRTQRHAPDYLYLKIGFKSAKQARREVEFYERIVTVMKRRVDNSLLLFPTCYDSYYDESSNQFHLILDDFTQEYSPSKDHAPPTARHREHVMDTLAILHAYWWEHPLSGELAPLPTAEKLNSLREQHQSQFNTLKTSVGQYLDAKYLNILEKIASGLPPKQEERLLTGTGLTIIHNNLVPDNLVYTPRETLITNWENWSIGVNTDDLAMMIPLHWPEHLRKFQEKQLLKRYYDTIKQQGVKEYSWDELENDYKASLARIIGKLLAEWTMDVHTRGHWRVIEAAIDSFIEMDGISIYSS